MCGHLQRKIKDKSSISDYLIIIRVRVSFQMNVNKFPPIFHKICGGIRTDLFLFVNSLNHYFLQRAPVFWLLLPKILTLPCQHCFPLQHSKALQRQSWSSLILPTLKQKCRNNLKPCALSLQLIRSRMKMIVLACSASHLLGCCNH